MYDPNDQNDPARSYHEPDSENTGSDFLGGCLKVLLGLVIGFVGLVGLAVVALFIICSK